ncbi:hypothetical protein PR048_017430 [Dryococelus australis]|uniref:Uncharacterized protein n=1 Tax=Dryococelus australis TaxID=614101 RepID=A0ABQ9H9K0_9NEOP|nr:hypothetical protein PR048_017430 [Dryococelus australis]
MKYYQEAELVDHLSQSYDSQNLPVIYAIETCFVANISHHNTRVWQEGVWVPDWHDKCMQAIAAMRGWGKQEIPDKTHRPTALSGTIPTCENPVTRPGIEPSSPWWEASGLTAQPITVPE